MVMIAWMIVRKRQGRGLCTNCPGRLEESEMASHVAGLDTIMHAQLPINALDLCANSRDGNDQGLRDLRIGGTSRKQAQHLLLLRAEGCHKDGRNWSDDQVLLSGRGGRCMQNGLEIGA